MRLAIDLDGVVADFNTGWTTLYNNDFGTDLNASMVDKWGAMLDITHFDTMDEFWDWAHQGDGPGLFRHLPLYPDAKDSLDDLARAHEIVIVTAKPRWANSETFAWIADNQIPTGEVHITEHKWKVDCDVYLDDGPTFLEDLVRERPDRSICRFVRAWNSPVPGAIDIHSWDDFVTLVDRRYC